MWSARSRQRFSSPSQRRWWILQCARPGHAMSLYAAATEFGSRQIANHGTGRTGDPVPHTLLQSAQRVLTDAHLRTPLGRELCRGHTRSFSRASSLSPRTFPVRPAALPRTIMRIVHSRRTFTTRGGRLAEGTLVSNSRFVLRRKCHRSHLKLPHWSRAAAHRPHGQKLHLRHRVAGACHSCGLRGLLVTPSLALVKRRSRPRFPFLKSTRSLHFRGGGSRQFPRSAGWLRGCFTGQTWAAWVISGCAGKS